MFWTDPKEQEFLLNYLDPNYDMLEYGSGKSTIILQDKVRMLVSVEHHKGWYNVIKSQLSKPSVIYICAESNNFYWEDQFDKSGNKNVAGDDGTFEDFMTYVLSPIKYGPYDIVFIDGRARVSCAAFAALKMLKPEGRIFIHDFGQEAKHPTLGYRTYYDQVLQFLEIEDHVGTMYRFKVK